MKKIGVFLLVFAMGLAAQAVVIDDFSDPDLTNRYDPNVVILDTDVAGGSNTAAWEVSGGRVQLNTTAFQSIEQNALIYQGLSLAVGEELQIDVTPSGIGPPTTGYFGIYVGGVAPPDGSAVEGGLRENYIAVYMNGANGSVLSRGFDGLNEYGGTQNGAAGATQLFIANIDGSTFETGWYAGEDRTILVTRTPVTANAATFVGLYSDARNTGAPGSMDNLTVIPEPASLALFGLAGMVLFAVRRRR